MENIKKYPNSLKSRHIISEEKRLRGISHKTVSETVLSLLSANKIKQIGLSPSKKLSIISFIECPLKITDAFYFILKALFVLKISKAAACYKLGHRHLFFLKSRCAMR